MDFSECEIKAVLFEIFAAGYEAGYAAEKDIRVAYENWWNYLKALLLKGQ